MDEPMNPWGSREDEVADEIQESNSDNDDEQERRTELLQHATELESQFDTVDPKIRGLNIVLQMLQTIKSQLIIPKRKVVCRILELELHYLEELLFHIRAERNVVRVCHHVSYLPTTTATVKKTNTIDIVSEGGARWIKLRVSQNQASCREGYLEAANILTKCANTHETHPNEIFLLFCNKEFVRPGADEKCPLISVLTGCKVSIETSKKEQGDKGFVNLDICACITLVSHLSHLNHDHNSGGRGEGHDGVASTACLSHVSGISLEIPTQSIAPFIHRFHRLLEDKKLIMGASAMVTFKEMVSSRGSEQEKKRAKQLIDGTRIVEDVKETWPRTFDTIQPLTKCVFAVGKFHGAPTWTSNKKAARFFRQFGYVPPDLILYLPSRQLAGQRCTHIITKVPNGVNASEIFST